MATEKNALERIRSKRNQVQHGEAADWSAVDGKLLANAVAWVAATGGAVRLGYTRDGYAYAIGLYYSDQHRTEYVRPSEDVEQYLRGLAEDFEAIYRETKRG